MRRSIEHLFWEMAYGDRPLDWRGVLGVPAFAGRLLVGSDMQDVQPEFIPTGLSVTYRKPDLQVGLDLDKPVTGIQVHTHRIDLDPFQHVRLATNPKVTTIQIYDRPEDVRLLDELGTGQFGSLEDMICLALSTTALEQVEKQTPTQVL